MFRLLQNAARVLVVAVMCVGFSAGCKKQAASTGAAADAGTEALRQTPGGAEVVAALEKKDYDGVIASLMKARQMVTNDEQQRQFMILALGARTRISEAAATDPKAAEAVAMLRSMTMGR